MQSQIAQVCSGLAQQVDEVLARLVGGRVGQQSVWLSYSEQPNAFGNDPIPVKDKGGNGPLSPADLDLDGA